MQFPLPLLIFIYPMIGLLICKYEPFWQEVEIMATEKNYIDKIDVSNFNQTWYKASLGTQKVGLYEKACPFF